MTPEPQVQLQTSVDVKLDYIQRDIREIKDGMKDNVTRREFTDALVTIRRENNESLVELKASIVFLQKIIFGFIALIVISVMAAIFKMVIK